MMLNVLRITLLVTLVKFTTTLSTEWLSICPEQAKEKSFLIHDTGLCSSGFYLQEPIQDFCICANGLWQLKSDFCGDDTIFVDGHGNEANSNKECFFIKKRIKWIRYIGHTHFPHKEYNFVTDNTFTTIVKIKSGAVTKAGYSYVVTANPRHHIWDCRQEICLPVKKEQDNTYSAGNLIPRLMFHPIMNNTGMLRPENNNCPGGVEHTSYKYGVPVQGMSDGLNFYRKVDAVSSKCQETCFPNFNKLSIPETEKDKDIPGIRSWDDLLVNPTTETPNIPSTLNISTTESTIELQEYPGSTSDTESELACTLSQKPPGISEKMKKDVAAQTERMVYAHYNALIKGERSEIVTLLEYNYFQTSRYIFEKVCPQTEVPVTLLRQLLLLFRLALKESLTKYPYQHVGDKDEDLRLTANLEACLKRAEADKVGYTFQYDANRCPSEFQRVSITYKNGLASVNSNVSCDSKFNSSRHDYPMETAWKVVMFAHYYCARHFDKSAFDHSRFEYKLRHFFNREIITRWYHPGRATQTFEHIFKEYDLERFKNGLDRCVSAAKNMSPYRQWIKRPTFEISAWPNQKGDGHVGMESRHHSNLLTRAGGKTPISFLEGKGYCMENEQQFLKTGTHKPTQTICYVSSQEAECDR